MPAYTGNVVANDIAMKAEHAKTKVSSVVKTITGIIPSRIINRVRGKAKTQEHTKTKEPEVVSPPSISSQQTKAQQLESQRQNKERSENKSRKH